MPKIIPILKRLIIVKEIMSGEKPAGHEDALYWDDNDPNLFVVVALQDQFTLSETIRMIRIAKMYDSFELSEQVSFKISGWADEFALSDSYADNVVVMPKDAFSLDDTVHKYFAVVMPKDQLTLVEEPFKFAVNMGQGTLSLADDVAKYVVRNALEEFSLDDSSKMFIGVSTPPDEIVFLDEVVHTIITNFTDDTLSLGDAAKTFPMSKREDTFTVAEEVNQFVTVYAADSTSIEEVSKLYGTTKPTDEFSLADSNKVLPTGLYVDAFTLDDTVLNLLVTSYLDDTLSLADAPNYFPTSNVKEALSFTDAITGIFPIFNPKETLALLDDLYTQTGIVVEDNFSIDDSVGKVILAVRQGTLETFSLEETRKHWSVATRTSSNAASAIAATTGCTQNNFANPTNAQGVHNGTYASIASALFTAKGGRVRCQYADFAKANFVIDSVHIYYYWSVTVALASIDVAASYRLATSGAWTDIATWACTTLNQPNFLTTPYDYDATAVLDTWTKLNALEASINACLPSGLGVGGQINVDAIEVGITAHQTI